MSRYFGVLFPASEGGFVVHFPDFEEAFTQGDDYADAVEMGEDVLDITTSYYRKEKRKLPRPSSLEQTKAWAERYRHNPGIDSTSEYFCHLFPVVHTDPTPVRISATIARGVLDIIDSKAEELGMSRSGFLATAAMAYKV